MIDPLFLEIVILNVGYLFTASLAITVLKSKLSFTEAITFVFCLILETAYFCIRLLKAKTTSLDIIIPTIGLVFFVLIFCSGFIILNPISFIVSMILITIIIIIVSYYILRYFKYNFLISIIMYCVVTLYYSILLIHVPTYSSSNYKLYQSFYYCYNLPDLQASFEIIPLISRCIQFIICRIADVLLLGQFITSVKKHTTNNLTPKE